MAYFQLKRLFSSLVFGAIRHSCQSSYTEAWLILYVGRLPVKKQNDKNKPATPPPSLSLVHSGPTNLNAGLNLMIQRDSLFLITNEGVFSKWIGVGGIGGNWSIIWRIHIFSVHLLPFCFVTHVSLFGRRRKNKSLIASHCMSGHFSCVHLNPRAPRTEYDEEKVYIWEVTRWCKFHRFHDLVNVSILINCHLTHTLFIYSLWWIWNHFTAMHPKIAP